MTRDEKRIGERARRAYYTSYQTPYHITPQSTIDAKYLQMRQNRVIPIAVSRTATFVDIF